MMRGSKQQICGQLLCDCFSLHGELNRDLVLPEHMLYVKLLERLQDMLHSAMQSLESSIVDFV